MTVNELIKKLQALPGDYTVIMSKDAEANSASPCVEAELGRYGAESTYAGDLYEAGAPVDELPGGTELVVVLWPTN